MCLTPGGPVSEAKKAKCEKKASDRESAEAIVGEHQTPNVVNLLLSPKVLALPNKKENRPGLVDPLAYYLGNT